MEKKSKKNSKKKKGVAFAWGIAVGILLYKVITDILWPMIFQ